MKSKPRVLAIGLDGYEPTIAERLMIDGELPNLAELSRRGIVARLDHGSAKHTGLAWEHFSSGLSPEHANRWSAVDFDPNRYTAMQVGVKTTPFAAAMTSKVVVFDVPYFDLASAPKVNGLVNWGAHDPGVEASARPAKLLAEVVERFGAYPATPWIYGFVWPSPVRTEQMGRDLVRAVDVRADAATWVLKERCPEWDLGIVVISEYHSAIEALWHGVDDTHPLHRCPSAQAARDGLLNVYRAADRMIGQLMTEFPDAVIIAFSMHGMGPNQADVPSMLLLPELLYRREFGSGRFSPAKEWAGDAAWAALPEGQDWSAAIRKAFDWEFAPDGMLDRIKSVFMRRESCTGSGGHSLLPLNWMPAAWYQPAWSQMRAFALPSFYDGRIRINLQGREARGVVPPGEYASECASLEQMLRELRDPLTGLPCVASVELCAHGDPASIGVTGSDMVVLWNEAPLQMVHPDTGVIGPAPFRRTGGHTGGFGYLVIAGGGIRQRDAGVCSAFDVVPTLLNLLADGTQARVSGTAIPVH